MLKIKQLFIKKIKRTLSPIKKIIPDKLYIQRQYYRSTGEKLNLDNPVNFNQKLQWLKLYNRNKQYTKLADKYAVREYITEQIGEKYLVPLLGVWKRYEDINLDKLPKQFVLKCTHDSDSVVICKDKSTFDFISAKKKLKKCLKRNYYWAGREWVYKNIKPQIIAEQYMVDESGMELKDYKIFCFNGDPKIIQVDFDRFTNHKRNFYSIDWQYQSLEVNYPTCPEIKIKKPLLLDKMLELVGKLSKDIPHVRVDFYSIGEQLYFSEFTFYHGNGGEKFSPFEWNKKFGEWLILPEKRKTRKLHLINA